MQRFARPQGRARIETALLFCIVHIQLASPGLKAGRGLKHPPHTDGMRPEYARFARPQGRARIETKTT